MVLAAGDRILVYATLNGIPARSKGTLMEPLSNERVRVKLDPTPCRAAHEIWAHPKQVRKLRPKEKRKRLWVKEWKFNHDDDAVNFGWQHNAKCYVATKEPAGGGAWTEFVEARRK